MKHQDISKLCADTLRLNLSDTYGIKLKSGHAHEIVAAFFGYRSRIAMLADRIYPIIDLADAEFIVLQLPILLVDQRLKDLEGLPPDWPPSTILATSIYSTIKDNTLAWKIFPDMRDLVFAIAEDRLIRDMGKFGMSPKSLNMTKESAIQESESEVLATVNFGYGINTGGVHRYRKYDIRLPRVAANLGYGVPEVSETLYSGLARTHSDEELEKMYPTLLNQVRAKL